MNVVVFDADEFLSLYPQFQNVFTPEQLGIFFNAACLLLDNTENSKVKDLTERKTSATEGKVSVGLQAYTNNPNWYSQTQCGSMFWLATAKYRAGMRYIGWTPC